MKKEENKEKTRLVGIAVMVVVISVSMLFGWLVANVSSDVSEKTYNVAFDLGNGTNNKVVKIEEKNSVIRPAEPTREGYIFEGWYVGDKMFDFNTEITEDITITAKWTKEPEKYTVTFDSNGGSNVAAVVVEEGKTATKPSNPTRSGYTFAGWYVGDTVYDFATAITGDITITAKWNKVQTSNNNGSSSTTQKDVITWTSVKVQGSLYPQVRIYIVKNGKYVAGTADFVDTTGAVVRKSVPATGKLEPAGSVKTLKNIKVN